MTSTSGSNCAIASVEVPVPQPISSTSGASRPNQARVSSGSSGRIGAVLRCRHHPEFGPQPLPGPLLGGRQRRTPRPEAGGPAIPAGSAPAGRVSGGVGGVAASTGGCARIRSSLPINRWCCLPRPRLIPNSCLRLVASGSRPGGANVTIRAADPGRRHPPLGDNGAALDQYRHFAGTDLAGETHDRTGASDFRR